MKSLKELFKKSKKLPRLQSSSFGSSPEADWRIIFLSSILIGFLIVVFSVFMFVKIDQGEIFTSEVSPVENDKEILDTELLQETIDNYRAKILEFEKARNSKTLIVDPSL